MKQEIHPKLNPVVFVDVSCGAEFPTLSTLSSEETKTIDGVEHFVIRTEISSGSHSFWTGKQKLMDTAGRVERFRKRYAKQDKAKPAKKN